MLTPLEERKLRVQAEADFERERLSGAAVVKKRKGKGGALAADQEEVCTNLHNHVLPLRLLFAVSAGVVAVVTQAHAELKLSIEARDDLGSHATRACECRMTCSSRSLRQAGSRHMLSCCASATWRLAPKFGAPCKR